MRDPCSTNLYNLIHLFLYMKWRKPSYTQWKDVVAPIAQEYALDFLSNPDMWGDEYIVDGKQAFVDDESDQHMSWRSKDRLIDNWVVRITPAPEGLDWEVTNTKMVGSYNLEQLLFEGTDDYHIKPEDAPMTYWYRYQERWFGNRKSRHGIRPQLVKLFRALEKKGVLYGIRKAISEWRHM